VLVYARSSLIKLTLWSNSKLVAIETFDPSDHTSDQSSVSW